MKDLKSMKFKDNDLLKDKRKYVKFYNVKSKDHDFEKIQLSDDLTLKITEFTNKNNVSDFKFLTGIFALYLSRIDGTGGCILKNSKESFIIIDYDKDNSFIDYLNQVTIAFDNPYPHNDEDIEIFYSINDFDNENSVLTLNICENLLELVYNASIFSKEYMANMASNLSTLINNVLDSPFKSCGKIDLLSSDEKLLINSFTKGESIDVGDYKTFSQAFHENAMKTPNKIAVDDGKNQITYKEMDHSSNSIANILQNDYNITPNTFIGLMLPRSYHFLELVLSINKIGAIFVPIEPDYPNKRIEHMINIANCKYIITTRVLSESKDIDIDMICIEDLNSANDEDIEILSNEKDLFSIIFTSGTTGIPKGVKVSNKQIRGLASAYNNIVKWSDDDIIGGYPSFSFVASSSVYYALYLGFTCRIFNENEKNDILLLIESLKEKPITELTLPPVIGSIIFENEDIDLKYIGVGGAKLNEIKNRKSKTKLINLYGTTEVILSVTNIYDLDNIYDKIPIGKPIANTWVYILDDDYNQVPIGVPGQICTSSEYLSPGYLHNKELTDEVFIENPFSDCDANKRMYCTGDIGYYNFDGEIEIIGRMDNQLSVRGFRIESGEILNIMKKFNQISDVYLDVDSDNLIVYYTTDDDLDINTVKDALKDELPPYMIPSLFIKLDKIPLNFNGKIDKFALKDISRSNNDIEINDEILKCVVDAYREVLNLDCIYIDDDFVALGGNSLSTMKLQRVLKNKLNVNLHSNEILELSTPFNISNHIKSNLSVMKPVEINYTFKDICPLSEAQLNVYLDESVKSMGTAYNLPFKISFDENQYTIDEIKNAISKLLDTHPVLSARVINNKGALSFTFDGKPQIISGTINDIDSFVKPFKLDECLSRFLIVEDEGSILLYADFHHLVFDGSSTNVLLNNLLEILQGNRIAFVDNGVLKQLSFEENIDPEYMSEAKKFFNNMFSDQSEASNLINSVDAEDSINNSYINEFNFDEDKLVSFLRTHNITHNQFLCSVFAYTLSRFTGSSKVLFNLIEDGRGHVDLIDSVGMFVCTLPLLINCENQDISSFLKESSDLITSAIKYDLYPLSLLVKEHDINSNISFQYAHDIFKDSKKYNIVELPHDTVHDLTFYIYNLDKNTFAIKVLHSNKYSRDFIKTFVKTYEAILQEIMLVEDLSQINYTDSADLEILNDYNKTECPLGCNDILDAFNENLLKNPDNQLVSYKNNSYSYNESAFIANKLAKLLKAKGVNAQDCVAFLVERSEYYMFSILSIMSMGAVYVPLDDAHPDERIKFILEDTKSKVLMVCDETYSRAVNLINDDDVVLLNISDILKGNIGTLNNLPVVYNNLACILYTSGSTGVPKGVKITRKAILNVSASYIDNYNLSKNDIVGLFSSIGFDVSSIVINSVLYVGACLNVISDELKLNVIKMNDYFIKNNVSHAFLSTQVGKIFMDNIYYTSLDVLIVAGEKLGEVRSPKNYLLFDAYGPTEALIVSSVNNNDKIDPSDIGKLNYNTRIYILDDNLNPVPIGAVGELCVAGYQIAEGYLNRGEETKLAFIENPFDNDEDYNVIYRTGDMVRLLPNGSLSIVGRRDSQVKIRGNRVELTEVESVIRSMDIVDDVTVQTVNNNGNNELVAYVVGDLEGVNLADYVHKYVNERKPEYMVPSYVVALDSIPLNVNGKIDRRALPDVDLDSLRVEYVAPTNEIEKTIVNTFEEVFNQKKIGIHDDFIRLGGDSLTAIKLLSYLDEYNITAADVLSFKTPKLIAENIRDNMFELDVYSLDKGCPLNESQLNVYLDIVANDKKDAYHIPLFMNISKKYNVHSIVDALNGMLDAHPILGMRVSDEFEVPYLVKGSKPEILVESDVSDEHVREFLLKPFDLHDCLCRFLIHETEDEHTLVAVFHHIIFDALSDNVFRRDLLSILDGKAVDLDDSFLKVSAFANQIKETEEYVYAGNFYEAMLADSEETGLLLDSVLGDGPGFMETDLDLDYDLFKSFLNKFNVSENVLFTSAFAYALSRFVGSEKVLFNVIDNGRDRFNNFDAIGMYVNTLPLLVDCKNQEVTSFIEYMSDLVYDVMKFDYYPFRVLANEYGINSNILFQFLPDWISYDHDYDSLESGDVENSLISGMNDLITDFSANIIQKGENYSLNIIYSDKYSRDFAKHFSKSYKLILHNIFDANDLSEINYTTLDDIKLLDELNKTERSLMYDDVLDTFNDNLAKYPNNNLVSLGDEAYTYGEGAFIADKIAKELIKLGVKSRDCVGFLLPRSQYYMISVLSILSIGGVYVPLDDNHPDERIRFILKDTEVSVIIVSDETYNRSKDLIDDNVLILNISDILKKDIGVLDYLPVVYGDLACILYTSGTTGIPKGVKITRKAILNLCENYVSKNGLNESDVYGLFASIGFDAASQAICQTFYAGACLSIIPEDIRFNMKKMNEYMIKQKITHTMLTTQVGKLFMEHIDDTSLKVLTVGGEKLGEFESPDNYKLIDGFGPTETFAFITSIENIDKVDSSSIGFLNYNTKAYILDNELRQVPHGAVGELYLAGNQIADGYLNREDETKKAFIKNPFENDGDYNILYRTGDIVRLLPDGTLGIIGRRDKQVKIRGNRVELLEVEKTIRELSHIDDVTVQSMKNKSDNELIAYVVTSKDVNNIEEEIRNHISESKPNYMIPSAVIELDQIPLDANGKVDARKLPKVTISTKNIAPQNKTEQEILKICRNLIENTDFGVTDNLLSLGFSSLTYMNLNYEIYSKYNINLSFTDLIECTTVRDISEILSQGNSNKFKKYEKRKLYPLTKDQIVVYESRNENPFAFKSPYSMKIIDVDVDKLKKAFIEFLNRHPFLKSTLTTIDGKHYIKREDEIDFNNLIRIYNVDEAEFESFENKVVLQDYNYIFNKYLKETFEMYPNKFLYCIIVENKNDVSVLLLMDHLFCDNYSVSLMFNEIDKIYANQEYKIDKEIIDGFDFNMFFYEDEMKNSELHAEIEKDIRSYGDLHIPAIREYEDYWCQHNSLSLVLGEKKGILEFCKKHNLPANHLFMSTFVLAAYKYCKLTQGILPVISNGRFFNEIMNTQHYIAKTIYLKFKTATYTNLMDVLDNINDEMKRIIKSEPNSFKLTYDSQWLFNFVASYENEDMNLTMSNYEKQTKKPSLIKNVGVNFINDVIIIEMHDQYRVNLIYHNMRYTDEYIGEFIKYWTDIIKYVLTKDELDLDLDFLDEI